MYGYYYDVFHISIYYIKACESLSLVNVWSMVLPVLGFELLLERVGSSAVHEHHDALISDPVISSPIQNLGLYP